MELFKKTFFFYTYKLVPKLSIFYTNIVCPVHLKVVAFEIHCLVFKSVKLVETDFYI